jgi:hypothetical protein
MRLAILIGKIEHTTVNKSSTFYLIFPTGCRREDGRGVTYARIAGEMEKYKPGLVRTSTTCYTGIGAKHWDWDWDEMRKYYNTRN